MALGESNPNAAAEAYSAGKALAFRHVLLWVILATAASLVVARTTDTQYSWVMAASALSLSTCCVGVLFASDLAVLEATGRTALANMLVVATAIALPLTFAAVQLGAGPVVLALIGAASSVAPFVFAAAFTGKTLARWRAETRRSPLARGDLSPWPFMGGSAAMLLSSGFDAVLIAAVLGPSDVTVYSLTVRILLPITLIPLALQPRMAAHFAALRGQGMHVEFITSIRDSVLRIGAASSAIAVLLGVAYPFVFAWLSAGQLQAPPGVFIGFCLYGIVFAVLVALVAAGTARGVVRSSATVAMLGGVGGIVLSLIGLHVFGLWAMGYAKAIALLPVLGFWAIMVARSPHRISGLSDFRMGSTSSSEGDA